MFNPVNLQSLLIRLEELDSIYSDLKGISLVTNEGLSLAAKMPHYINEDWLASVSAALLFLGKNTEAQFFSDEVRSASLHSQGSILFATTYNENTVLAVLLEGDIENKRRHQIVTHIREYVGIFI